MTPTTRSTPLLEHILANVLQADDDSPYCKAFAAEGIEGINDLVSLQPKEMTELTYEENGVPTRLIRDCTTVSST